MIHTCGHDMPEPRFMGRGMARQSRLAEYFGRPCRACAEAHAISEAHRLTDRHAVPLSGNALDAAITRAKARIERHYGPR